MQSNSNKDKDTMIQINDNNEYEDNEENEDIQDNNQTKYITITLMAIVVTIFSLSFTSYYLSFSSNNNDQKDITKTHQRSQLSMTKQETPEQRRLQRANTELQRIWKQLHQPLKYDDRIDGDYRTIGFFNANEEPVYAHKYKRNDGYYTLSVQWIKGESTAAEMSDNSEHELQRYYNYTKTQSDSDKGIGKLLESGKLVRHGYGVYTDYTFSNGGKYSGGFHEGFKNGYGELKANGYTYKGWWEKGERAGLGIANNDDGTTYGQFEYNTFYNGFVIKDGLFLAEYNASKLVALDIMSNE